MTTVLGNPGSGAGQTTLQGAYDNSLGAVPQILLDGVPTPISIRASVSGSVLEIQDVAGNTMFEVDADPDLIVARTGVTVENAFTNGAAPVDITLSATYTQTGAFIGGGILSNGTITTGVSTTWIWALLQESKRYQIGINPAFAAFTLFNALPTIANSGNFNLVQGLILNNGMAHARESAGTSTTPQTIGLSNSPQTRATVSGAVMTKTTGDTAVRHSPTFSSVAGSTVNFGTQRGLHCLNPALALFQPGAGVETMTAYIGVEMNAIPFGGNVTKRTIRSALTAATNSLMIENTGGAASDFGAGGVHFDDNTPVQFGGAAFNAQDASIFWNPGGTLDVFFASFSDSLEISSPAADRFLFSANARAEFNFDVDAFSFGAQSGANGNQVGNFVTPARTIPVGGDWADFLLTQAGNLTVGGNAMSRVSAWVINGVSYASSSGTVTNADTLTVGGFPTSSPGVTITDRQSLNVIGGRSRLDSIIQTSPISPAALSAGNNNDYAGLLTGSANNGMRGWARLTPNGAGSTLTGIDSTAVQDGDTIVLTNLGAATITITNQDVASLAANRIDLGSYSGTLATDDSCTLKYDTTSGFWRVVGANFL